MKKLLLYYLLSGIYTIALSQDGEKIMSDKNEKFLGLRTSIYMVTDLKKAKEWYSNVFAIEPYFDEDFYIGFNIGGYELALMPSTIEPDKKLESVITYWGVEKIDDVYKHLLSAGATMHEAPKNVGGDLMVASVYDPWGNILGIIYNPVFKLKD